MQGTLIGKTGSAEYYAKGAWVYRRTQNGMVVRYDTVEGFAREWNSGAYGSSWRDTEFGKNLIERFTH
jgi:hypothetical protein